MARAEKRAPHGAVRVVISAPPKKFKFLKNRRLNRRLNDGAASARDRPPAPAERPRRGPPAPTRTAGPAGPGPGCQRRLARAGRLEPPGCLRPSRTSRRPSSWAAYGLGPKICGPGMGYLRARDRVSAGPGPGVCGQARASGMPAAHAEDVGAALRVPPL